MIEAYLGIVTLHIINVANVNVGIDEKNTGNEAWKGFIQSTITIIMRMLDKLQEDFDCRNNFYIKKVISYPKQTMKIDLLLVISLQVLIFYVVFLTLHCTLHLSNISI